MDGKIRWLLLVSLGAVAMHAPARADNPRISLKLEKVTAAEAVAALSKASGVAVDLPPDQTPPGVPPPPVPAGLHEKASFNWSGVPFARALRQLCERYNLNPGRMAGGYRLYAGAAPPPLPAKRVGLVEKNGMRLFVRGVSINSSRSIRFDNSGEGFDNSNLSLELGCELGDGDADAIAGVENVTAKDDLGDVLVSPGRGFYGGGGYPDEWRGGANFPDFNPRARKLVWVEGDLMSYRIRKPMKVEFPLPLGDKVVRKQAGDVAIEVAASDLAPGRLALAPQPFKAGLALQARISAPPIQMPGPWGPWGPYGMAAALVGASGKIYGAMSFGGGGSRNGPDGFFQEINYTFPALAEPAAKLVFSWVERDEPIKLLSFRMQHIPLPPEGAFVRRRLLPPPPRPPASPSASPAPERAYYAKGGGTLVNRVQIGTHPAAEGTLSIGLSVKTNGDWSGIRWRDVEVGADGLARLEDLKPGTYRLFRIYRPKPVVAALTGAGRWVNEEVRIDVTAGKSITAPPLRWTAVAEKQAVSAGRGASAVSVPRRAASRLRR